MPAEVIGVDKIRNVMIHDVDLGIVVASHWWNMLSQTELCTVRHNKCI